MNRTIARRSVRIAVFGFFACILSAAQPWSLLAQAPSPSKVKFASISEADMREFLGMLASDAFEGRQMGTEGYGLASAYVADHLRRWGLKPIGDNGTYFQSVKLRGYRVTRNSTVTVEVKGQSRTFKHGDHVTFQVGSGGKQTLNFSGLEFVGYGVVSLPNATSTVNYNDFANREVRGKAILMVPGTPAVLGSASGGRGRGGMGSRPTYAIQTLGASAVFGYAPAPAPPTQTELALQQAQDALLQAQQAVASAQAAARGGGARAGGGGRGGQGGRAGQPAATADITTVQKVDNVVPPYIVGDDEFYDFVFGAAGLKFADIKARAEKGEPLVTGALLSAIPAKITVNIDNSYEVLTTRLTKNVVGMVEGTDPKLKDTYVMFGSHLDHEGYREAATAGRGGGGGRGGQPASGPPDLIWNGADDDGSGSTALMGIAKAFATGPKPKRSVIFVWHAGEEAGLLGSRYMADFPVVPLDKVQAQFNIDMIGRSRNDDPKLANSVFVIGPDRISTDLHNLVVDTNATLAKPLTLDYEYNDPSDPNSFYTRSDHYSYAAKGIPIAFFFTGTHADYHGAGDHADKILYPKLTAITQMIYQSGFNVANSERTLTRDNKGPRAGRGFSGRIDK
jgi:hypothetical protein